MKTKDKLLDYFHSQSEEIIDKWLGMREVDQFSIFDANASTEVEEKLKQESGSFIRFMTGTIADKNEELPLELLDWSNTIAKERVNDGTSIDKVLDQFHRFRSLYFHYLKTWLMENEDMNQEDRFDMIETYHSIFDDVIKTFVISYKTHYENRLKDQMGLINELSSPIIPLSETIAILPIVGDIDTMRAKFIIEHTLEECVNKEIQHLVVDLSAVPIIDTMVAQKIFELMNTLTLVGVHPLITGIRPAIAQTAVQLGIPLGDLNIHSTLIHALKNLGYIIKESH
ncbi:STAS domain-containing protein [Rossellomorea aquimaris]|uniref:STAS domain-containing protein n=1 Tax=Rossellomorea aquimaris TaxID=189382 RepID=UPI001CD45372|nr:STAS domain-containing protein [Rossellomorea aquimaris]MCA1060537.1 STAS domain-containing protein [Rossellomorea aquimaris]